MPRPAVRMVESAGLVNWWAGRGVLLRQGQTSLFERRILVCDEQLTASLDRARWQALGQQVPSGESSACGRAHDS
jgi:hypothetical protein